MYLVELQIFDTNLVFKKCIYGNWYNHIKSGLNGDFKMKKKINAFFRELTRKQKGWRINLIGEYKDSELAHKCFKVAKDNCKGKVYLINNLKQVDKLLLPYL